MGLFNSFRQNKSSSSLSNNHHQTNNSNSNNHTTTSQPQPKPLPLQSISVIPSSTQQQHHHDQDIHTHIQSNDTAFTHPHKTHHYMPICNIVDVGTVYHSTKPNDPFRQHGYTLRPMNTSKLYTKNEHPNHTESQYIHYIVKPSAHVNHSHTLLYLHKPTEIYYEKRHSLNQNGTSTTVNKNKLPQHMDGFWGTLEEDEMNDDNLFDEEHTTYYEAEVHTGYSRQVSLRNYDDDDDDDDDDDVNDNRVVSPTDGTTKIQPRPITRKLNGRPQSAVQRATSVLVRAQSAAAQSRRGSNIVQGIQSYNEKMTHQQAFATLLQKQKHDHVSENENEKHNVVPSTTTIQASLGDDVERDVDGEESDEEDENGSEEEEDESDSESKHDGSTEKNHIKAVRQCAVCSSTTIVDPWMSTCLHLCCATCWVEYLQNANNTCAECGLPVDVDELKSVQLCIICHDVCHDGYTNPLCNHTACKTCWRNEIEENENDDEQEDTLSCPVCSSVVDVNAVQ